MSGRMKFAIAGAIIGLIIWIFGPWWLGLALVVLALGIPAAGYLMLDPSQRRRLRNIQQRKQLGR